ncbi:nucleoside recognition protein [Halobaculum sp. MBLA0147]|uniref:nucleoside recognition protein n=1 Tax=Halobaculum sp. MBLA0147 TaxID=3079934 RepID=UPI003524A195
MPTAARRVARIAVLIGLGVFLANLAVEYGAVEKIAGVSRYLTGPANLPDEVGTAILTTAASTTAGYGMLADFRESGRLSDRATLVAVTINTFFGFTQHVFTFYVPVLIPILGPDVGVLYVGTRGGIALGISLVGVLAGAVLLSDGDVDESVTVETESDSDPETDPETAPDGGTEGSDGTDETGEGDEETEPGAVAAAWASTASKLRRIVPRLAAVYLLVTVLAAAELFRSLSAAAGPLAEVTGLPAAAVPVIVVFAFDTTAGAATVAPLIGDTLTVDQAVVTMLLGGIVTFAVSTFKRSIPFQYGIWGASFGSKVIVVNTVLKVVFISAAVVAFLV